MAHIRSRWSDTPVVRALLLGLAYFAAAELSHRLSFPDRAHVFATIWLPAGLLLAVLSMTPRRHWPVCLLAAGLANVASDVLLHGKTLPVSLTYSIVNGLEACIGVALLRRFGASPLLLERTNHTLVLAGVACLAPVLSAAISAAVISTAFERSYAATWLDWWFADALGIIMGAPVVFAWSTPRRPSSGNESTAGIAEGTVLLIGLSAVSHAVCGELIPMRFGAPAYVLPFLLWSVVRFRMRMVTTAVLLVGVVAVWNSAHGRGPYISTIGWSPDAIFRVQGVAAVINVCMLVLASIIAERRKAEEERIATVARLEQALTELRQLKEMIPMCAWCHRIRDDLDGWQKIETYLRTHMQADVTHGICPECFDAQFAPNTSAETSG